MSQGGVMGFLNTYPLAVGGELLRILPDSIIIVSGLMAILTASFPMAVFFFSLLESVVGFHLLQKMFTMFDISFIKPSDKIFSPACHTGFQSATLTSFFGSPSAKTALPSAPLYLASVAASYLFMSMNAHIKELEALGPAYSSRYYIGVFALLSFLFVLGAYRMYSGCETLGIVMISIFLGLIIGAMLIYQNNAILGPDSINMVSVPLLRNRAVTGEKLYVCSPSSN